MLSLDYYFELKTQAASGGTQVGGTKDIIENGLHDVASYKFAMVNVPVPTGAVVFEGQTDNDTEVFIPIHKNYYYGAFVGNAVREE